MMKSRKINRLVTIFIPCRNLAATTGGGRTADTAVHAVGSEETDNNRSQFKPTTKDDDLYFPPKNPGYPPSDSSPKVQSTGVNQFPERVSQQKRHRSFFFYYSGGPPKELDCAGLDGSPSSDREEQQVKENNEYCKHRKASPLSELEMVDTRKPITRATDGTAADSSYYAGTPKMVLWRPEQLDTAEDSLRRAMEIWRSNAMRGDPDSPHGRILRTLCGDYW